MVKCTSCEHENMSDAQFCEKCGSSLNIAMDENDRKDVDESDSGEISTTEINSSSTDDDYVNRPRIVYSKKPATALILSLLFFSFGQFYNGQILKGMIFIVVIIVLAHIFYPIGLILSFLMIIYSGIDAYRNAKAIDENNGNYFYTTND